MLLRPFVEASICFPDVVGTTTRTFDLVDHIGSAENWGSVFGGSEVANFGGFREDFDFDLFSGI